MIAAGDSSKSFTSVNCLQPSNCTARTLRPLRHNRVPYGGVESLKPVDMEAIDPETMTVESRFTWTLVTMPAVRRPRDLSRVPTCDCTQGTRNATMSHAR